jgi:hypothetical protein
MSQNGPDFGDQYSEIGRMCAAHLIARNLRAADELRRKNDALCREIAQAKQELISLIRVGGVVVLVDALTLPPDAHKELINAALGPMIDELHTGQ